MPRGYPDWFSPHSNSDIPLPTTESIVTDTDTSESTYETLNVISKTLDETFPTYLTRLVFRAFSQTEMFTLHSHDVIIVIVIGGNMRWEGMFNGGLHTASKVTAADPFEYLARTFPLQLIKVPADTTVTIQAFIKGIPIGTVFTSLLAYITEVNL